MIDRRGGEVGGGDGVGTVLSSGALSSVCSVGIVST